MSHVPVRLGDIDQKRTLINLCIWLTAIYSCTCLVNLRTFSRRTL